MGKDPAGGGSIVSVPPVSEEFETVLKCFLMFFSLLSSPVPAWTYSCPRWREVQPSLQLSCHQSPNPSSRSASSPPSEMKADPLHSGKTRHRTANPGASDRETMTTDSKTY